MTDVPQKPEAHSRATEGHGAVRSVQGRWPDRARRAAVVGGSKGDAVGSPPVRKQKRCRVCGELFTPYLTLQLACGIACAKVYGAANNKALLKRGQKVERAERVKERRAWRDKTRTTREEVRDTQRECNRYVLERDREKGCISCHMPANYGGQFHAGHYRTTAAAPQLRFDVRQIRKQCAQCNTMKSGNVIEYRKRLVVEIGVEAVEEIENNSEIRRWDRDELVAMRKDFTAKRKELMAQRT